MPYLSSFAFPIDEGSEDLLSSQRFKLSHANSEEGLQLKREIPEIKVLTKDLLDDANLKGNSQILVIDDDKAELKTFLDREPRKTEQNAMRAHQGVGNFRYLQKAN